MNDITYVGKHTVIYTVSRHAHESWEFVYCTFGSGTFLFDDRSLDYRDGDVVVIPPMTPHSNASADGFQNIHINMVSPALSFSSPLVNKAWYLPIFWRNRNRRLPAGARVRWEEPGGGVREQELEGKCTLLVGNISSYAAGASPLAGNDFGDGLLRMLFLPNLSSFFFALGATRGRFGSWLFRTLHPVKTARCVEFFLPAGEALQIDGEMVDADGEGMTGRWVRISRLGRVRLLSLE